VGPRGNTWTELESSARVSVDAPSILIGSDQRWVVTGDSSRFDFSQCPSALRPPTLEPLAKTGAQGLSVINRV
jgi:hypothetical protein